MTSSDNALEQLISQFAQPLAFLRELIQNSLDAGTSLIEVEVGYDQESQGCFVRVNDNGHGMNRQIIDTRLTRLFASTKENDLTKIGKFGIGFVSIFAIKPELVVLETGADGEAWRLLFLPDRSFERRELKHPVEGTCVTVFTSRPESQLAKLQRDCEETVTFWCKHSDVEIHFNGKPINQPFDLPDSPYQYRYKTEAAEIVISPSLEPSVFHGYYNRGLTLLEGKGSPLPRLAFKIRSRYLEHTLSRDNILHDESYEKAMALVRQTAYERMPVHLFEQLAQEYDPDLWALARVLVSLSEDVAKKVRKVKVFPTREGLVSLSQLPKTVLYGTELDELWLDVEATGETLLHIPEPDDDPRLNLLRDLGYSTESLDVAFFRYRKVETLEKDEEELLKSLRYATRQFFAGPFLVESLNTPKRWELRFSAFLHPGRRIESEPTQGRKWREAIGIRRGHPFWERVLQLHNVQPELALSLLVRMINLELDINRKHESRLFHTFVQQIRKERASS